MIFDYGGMKVALNARGKTVICDRSSSQDRYKWKAFYEGDNQRYQIGLMTKLEFVVLNSSFLVSEDCPIAMM